MSKLDSTLFAVTNPVTPQKLLDATYPLAAHLAYAKVDENNFDVINSETAAAYAENIIDMPTSGKFFEGEVLDQMCSVVYENGEYQNFYDFVVTEYGRTDAALGYPWNIEFTPAAGTAIATAAVNIFDPASLTSVLASGFRAANSSGWITLAEQSSSGLAMKVFYDKDVHTQTASPTRLLKNRRIFINNNILQLWNNYAKMSRMLAFNNDGELHKETIQRSIDVNVTYTKDSVDGQLTEGGRIDDTFFVATKEDIYDESPVPFFGSTNYVETVVTPAKATPFVNMIKVDIPKGYLFERYDIDGDIQVNVLSDNGDESDSKTAYCFIEQASANDLQLSFRVVVWMFDGEALTEGEHVTVSARLNVLFGRRP